MDDELPRITASLLRRADAMCPRRLHHEHESGKKLSPLGDAAFEVANRLQNDAATGHADPSVPIEHAFVDPAELDHEQRMLYRSAASDYVRHFGTDAVRTDDIGWTTEVDDVGVRLVGSVGIPLRHDDGTRELRVLRIGGSRMLDDVDMRFIILRIAEWAPDRLRIVIRDLIGDESAEYDIDVAHEYDAAREWLRERVETIRSRADRDRAIVGADCRQCQCIPGCPKLTREPL